MRYAFCCGVLMLGSVGVAADEADDRKQIQTTRQQWLRAFLSGDTETLDRLETDEFIVITRDTVGDKKSQLAGIKQRVDAGRWLPPGLVSVDVDVNIRFPSNNVAIVSGHVASKFSGQDELRMPLASTEVWLRTADGWRAAHLHYHQLDDSEPAAQQSSSNSRTKTFIDNTRGNPPRDNLLKALEMFSDAFASTSKQRPLAAADLGAGAGNETIHLIKNGWDVVAIDVAPYAIQTIKERKKALQDSSKSSNHGTLDARISSMQAMALEDDSLNLINASLSLPFVSQDDIKGVWEDIVGALKPGGVFTGHFFGPEHEWRNRPNMSFFAVDQLFRDLFDSSGLEVRYLTNDKEKVRLGSGGTAFFHTITVIAQKFPAD